MKQAMTVITKNIKSWIGAAIALSFPAAIAGFLLVVAIWIVSWVFTWIFQAEIRHSREDILDSIWDLKLLFIFGAVAIAWIYAITEFYRDWVDEQAKEEKKRKDARENVLNS